MKSFRDMMEPFQQYFVVAIADTPELMRKVQQVRYEVFCKEFHFEREEDCPGGLEHDDYDEHATHCLILHRQSGMAAGCVRLIHAGDDDDIVLPIERYCAASLRDDKAYPSRLRHDGVCEISRLAVSSHFRRRHGEHDSPLGASAVIPLSNGDEYRAFPLLSFALFMSVLSLAVMTRCRHSFSMMEPWLARHLQIMGFAFQQIGDVTDYHGARAPFHYTLEQAIADKERRPLLRELFSFIDPMVEIEARRARLVLH